MGFALKPSPVSRPFPPSKRHQQREEPFVHNPFVAQHQKDAGRGLSFIDFLSATYAGGGDLVGQSDDGCWLLSLD